jgi:hypothetical protein
MLSGRNQRMTEINVDADTDSIEAKIDRVVADRWRLIVTLFWVGAAIVLLFQKWHGIHWFSLSDTDDNMRFDQVRDWLGGQGWYDLRQHRLDPPIGFSIHWSRLVDLPLAGLILILNPLLGAPLGYRWACAIAPMLPMLLAFWMMAIVVRRLVSAKSYPLALTILLCGGDALSMWSPLRIDHHGWQLAFLMMTVAGLTEPNMRRSGVMIAISSALSLTIGLEMLPYVAFAGAAVALHWAWDRAETERMRVYGATMAIATGLCFLVFASNDNWHAVCDALSPVWLTTVGGAALLLAAISFAPAENRWVRLALVIGAGAIAGGLYVGLFPQCFGHRLEGIPPEADKLWLSHVSEARPVYLHPLSTIVPMAALPIAGTIGSIVAVWRRRGTRAGADWLPVTLFATLATGLMLWQIRTGPSAQMLAVPGATYIARWGFTRLRDSNSMLVRVLGPVAAFLVASGLVASLALDRLPPRYTDLKLANVWAIATGRQGLPQPPKATSGGKPKPNLTKLADRRCPTIPALAPIGRLPAATFFSFIDLGPRLITLTHHSAVAGPYHRNASAILDVEHAFRGTPDQAHTIIASHHAQYLLVCPHMSEGTIYQAEAPGGFYAKLESGFTPAWLAVQPLPKGSPYQLWKVTG